MIEIDNLSKQIKGTTVLDHVTMQMYAGTIYGLRGKNGSGKTMLMRCICGLIFPTSGEIRIDGKVVGKDISFPESIGVLLEGPSFLGEYTGFQNLKNLAGLRGDVSDDEISNVISAVGLMPNDKKKYKKYSLGMKQRLGIACALMGKPDILILDEPMNALDEKGVEQVKTLLLKEKERGALVILVCHDREDFEFLTDEVFLVEEGRIRKE